MRTTLRRSSSFAALLLVGGVLPCLLLFRAPAADRPKPAPVQGPLSPVEEAAAFHLTPGLRAELVAAEPEVESPVAMAFDEDGRLWVVEMQDYPNGPPPGRPAEGRIRILEDRDGDGRYEHATTFADHVLFCHGLMPWRGGVLVTMAPQILFLKDTDGDGKADHREVLYDGFTAANPQLRANHPVLGLDGYVYVANGLRGGQVRRAGRPTDPPVDINGMDFRFDPLNPDRFEAVAGMGQYGNTFDDWGRRFVCDNHNHLRHVVLANRHLKRNPFLAVPAVVQDVSELKLGPLSSGGKVYPLSHNWTTSNLHAGRFTSACSVFLYRGQLLPEECRGGAFTCEPAGNLVHQEVLRPHGATFQSRPAREGVEFLASPDDWFRPVFLADGPDGALYVADMYRAVIEHPEFMPPELKTRPDLLKGKHLGRIWRIVPENAAGRDSPKPHLSKASAGELVRLLKHPEPWWRDTARRLLLERQDRAAVEPLRQMLTDSKVAVARVAAAWLLDRFEALDDDLLLGLLKDDQSQVRENGLVLAERRLGKSKPVADRVVELAHDPDPRVRFQAALALGEIDDDRTLAPLARIAVKDADDQWTRLAVASAVPNRAGALIVASLRPLTEDEGKGPPRPARSSLLHELSALVGARRDATEVGRVLEALLSVSGRNAVRWQAAGLNGLAEGMGRRGQRLSDFFDALPQSPGIKDAEHLRSRVGALLKQAAAIAGDPKRDPTERLDAVRLLAHAPWAEAHPVLARLLKDAPSQDTRLAALRSLAAQPAAEVADVLMERWAGYTPTVRREVVEAMVQRPERALVLLKEVEAGRVKPVDLDATRVQQLLHYGRADVREHAAKLLRQDVAGDRKQALDRYRAALARKGDPRAGREVFKKNCATCHHVAGIGTEVGPDISDLGRTKTAEQLLFDIVNPNAAIDSNFVSYVVTTKNGKVVTGILAAETASSVTLRRAENQTDVVLRQDIEEIQSTGVSLMPDGVEKNISVAEMGDLLAFLKNWRYLDGLVPLGEEAGAKGR